MPDVLKRRAEDARVARNQEQNRAQHRHVESGDQPEVRDLLGDDRDRLIVVGRRAEEGVERLHHAVRVGRRRMLAMPSPKAAPSAERRLMSL